MFKLFGDQLPTDIFGSCISVVQMFILLAACILVTLKLDFPVCSGALIMNMVALFDRLPVLFMLLLLILLLRFVTCCLAKSGCVFIQYLLLKTTTCTFLHAHEMKYVKGLVLCLVLCTLLSCYNTRDQCWG